ncbi:MAG: hypothetical protein KDM64_04010, partial [Verrucomicrobiae bacterium]|nr:hypothetical protein [Verrucomicrobiae bacterium]
MKTTLLSKLSAARILPAGLVILAGIAWGEDAAVTDLRSRFSEAVSRVEQPLSELEMKYLESLGVMFQAEQGKGNLEGSLAIKKEIESFKSPGERQLDAWPELKRVREIYESASGKLKEQIAGERLRLFEAYRQGLQGHLERLTKAGNLEEAVNLSTEIKSLDKTIADAQAARPPALGMGNDSKETILWEFKSRASVE